jgi:hypothetical protein
MKCECRSTFHLNNRPVSGFFTAKALGLTIPKSFLPDEAIESCRASIQYQIRRGADIPLGRKGGAGRVGHNCDGRDWQGAIDAHRQLEAFLPRVVVG